MKKYFKFFPALILLVVFSCQKNDKNENLTFFEDSFTGKWDIVSYNMPKWGTGIYYNGKYIWNDTVLTELGTLDIPAFKAEQLLLTSSTYEPLDITLTIEEEEFPIEINYIYDRPKGAFVAFRTPDITGDTDWGKFLVSSWILSRNIDLKIINQNEIIILSPHEGSIDTLKLRRIR